MSLSPQPDPRVDQAAVSDEELLRRHEKLLDKQPDDRGHYRLMPLALLFVFAGFIFFGATYLGRFAGDFDPRIYDEHLKEFGTIKAAAAGPVAPVVLGEKLFNNAACNTCHQSSGLGVPGAFPPLAGSEWVQSEERAIRIVLHGLVGPITVKGANFNSAMPAFGKVAGGGFNWSDDKIAAVLTYVRQAWGNNAPPITAQKVTEIRTQEGNRKSWTPEELQKFP